MTTAEMVGSPTECSVGLRALVGQSLRLGTFVRVKQPFEVFYEENAAALLSYLQWSLAPHVVATIDLGAILAETMAEMYMRWDAIDSPLTYARVTALRAARKEYARQSHTVRPVTEIAWGNVSDIEHSWGNSSSETDPVEAAAGNELLMRAVEHMSFSEKQVFVRRVAGFNNAEVADALGITAKSVECRYRRAREKAQHSLEAAGYH